MMKLLTLNTHSLLEEHYLQKLDQFVDIIKTEQPDIISLQEVNQSIAAPPAEEALLEGWCPCLPQEASPSQTSHLMHGDANCEQAGPPMQVAAHREQAGPPMQVAAHREQAGPPMHGDAHREQAGLPMQVAAHREQAEPPMYVAAHREQAGPPMQVAVHRAQPGPPIRADNHAAQVASRLRQAGIPCSWTWVPAKIGYDKYDEGLAFLCLNQKIRTAESIFISGCRDYANWKTRKALGIQIEALPHWFYAVHMGWWQDAQEPFAQQWARLQAALQDKKKESLVWLMGDFNSPAEFRAQGYDCIQKSGWLDTYCLAEKKDSGITVEGCIDGWHPSQETPEDQKTQAVQEVQESQSVQEVQESQSVQEVQESQSVQEVQESQSVQEVQESQSVQEVQESQSVQEVQESQSVQELQELQELQGDETTLDGMRMDHIWCSRKVQVKKSQVLFNGKNGNIVSDHYGVLVHALI